MTLERLLLNLFTLQSNAVLISNALDRRIHSYRKQRRQCLLNILRAYRKKQALLKRKRSIWTKVSKIFYTMVNIFIKSKVLQTRTSKFWEEDVPKNGDQFFHQQLLLFYSPRISRNLYLFRHLQFKNYIVQILKYNKLNYQHLHSELFEFVFIFKFNSNFKKNKLWHFNESVHKIRYVWFIFSPWNHSDKVF